MRLREDDCVGNGLVPEQHLLHLPRRDLLAAAVDDLLEAPAQEEVAVVVEIALVARAEPPVGERLPVRVRVSLVAREDVRPANGNLADLAGREKQAIVVEHCDLRPCGAPDRAPLALVRRQRIDRHLVCGFGHSVRLEHGRVEEVFERVAHERRQRGRGGADESELSRARARPPGRAPGRPCASWARPCTRSRGMPRATTRTGAGRIPVCRRRSSRPQTGASTDATRPWMWKSGMTARQRSSAVSSSEPATSAADAQRFRSVRGTSFGRAVVPDVWRRSAACDRSASSARSSIPGGRTVTRSKPASPRGTRSRTPRRRRSATTRTAAPSGPGGTTTADAPRSVRANSSSCSR